MIRSSALDLVVRDAFLDLPDLLPAGRAILKLEGLSLGGSIKIKPAIALIEHAEASGLAVPGRTTFIESSSGNLGVAMAAVCAAKGYQFICVTDPCAASSNIAAIRAYGGEVVIVHARDHNGGYVATRIKAIERLCASSRDILWMNQYAHPANPEAHANQTAREILTVVPRVDWLVVGVGTGGTYLGCARAFAQLSPHTRVIAVDPAGSITFGGLSGTRLIPGIGNSRVPEIMQAVQPGEVVTVDERTTVETCRSIARRYGILLGGSSGSAVAAAMTLAGRVAAGETLVAIAPDMGDKYLDTIYDDEWVETHFGRTTQQALRVPALQDGWGHRA